MKESVEFIRDEERWQKIQELIDEGFVHICLGCSGVCKNLPQIDYEDGHGGRSISMCPRCGCDLFKRIDQISPLVVKVGPPVDGTLVFKEHHAKYCKCDVGELWTGDAETECFAKFELLEKNDDGKTLKCRKSGLKLVILKSTEEELTQPDEVGSTFLRIPEES